MSYRKPGSLMLALLAVALFCPALQAASQAFVRQQNLAEMTEEAALIYSGRVLRVESSIMDLAGGQLPTVTYTMEVTDQFKGTFQQKGDQRIATLTVAGSFKKVLGQVGNLQRLNTLPEPPAMRVGREYLVMANAPNQHGLSNTIGLGQGYFELVAEKDSAASAKAGRPVTSRRAVNRAGNSGLFRGMNEPKLVEAGKSLSYTDLADTIRRLLLTGENHDK